MDLELDKIIVHEKQEWQITAFLREASKHKYEFFGEKMIGDLLYLLPEAEGKLDLAFCEQKDATYFSAVSKGDVKIFPIFKNKK